MDSVRYLSDEVLPAICAEIATPRALTVAILCRYREWDQLAKLGIDPKHYFSAESYWRDASVTNLLRKWQSLPTTFDREAKAVENFWISERECCRTNIRLAPYLENGLDDPRDEAIWRVLRSIRKNVKLILGEAPEQGVYRGGQQASPDASDYLPPSYLEGILMGIRDVPLPNNVGREVDGLLEGRFGPGATFGDKGRLTTVADKMSSSPTLTSGAIGFLFNWAETQWATCVASSGRKIDFVRGNRFTTVPKDCTKDRGIAVEPSINVFYQLALGKLMKARLRKSGLDLLRAQEIHKRVACEASSRGNYATIDLSNASDTVARNLVRLLVPREWLELLESLRSPTTFIGGKTVRLEKFSSMGNGYTFELETLLFAAISMGAMTWMGHKPVLGQNVFVFGDDIIVPTACAQGVISVLRYLGFTPNVDKTFVDGPFRESCGGDFFQGVDVRPYYLKEELSEPQHQIALANGLRRACKGAPDARWHYLRRAWFLVLDKLPVSIRRLRGPEDLGDLVIHDEEARWQIEIEDRGPSRGAIYCKAYVPCEATLKWVSWKHFRPEVVLATALRGVGDGRRGVLPRDPISGYVVGRVQIGQLGFDPSPDAGKSRVTWGGLSVAI